MSDKGFEPWYHGSTHYLLDYDDDFFLKMNAYQKFRFFIDSMEFSAIGAILWFIMAHYTFEFVVISIMKANSSRYICMLIIRCYISRLLIPISTSAYKTVAYEDRGSQKWLWKWRLKVLSWPKDRIGIIHKRTFNRVSSERFISGTENIFL